MMTTDNEHLGDSNGSGGHNVPEFSVTELSTLLKRRVEEDFAHVRLRGEISGFKRAASGHLYFTLKDDEAVIDGVCWRGTAARLSIAPEDGMEVIAVGRVTTYPARSKYQVVVEAMELAGEGALLKLLEDRRRKLAADGLFDDEAKQALPYLPQVIGVVSSPTGAVIRDILHRLSDRFPCHVLLWPVLVQGESAADQIAAALDGFDSLEEGGTVPKPDVVIVARGGGSLEDLMAFNEENVVRAAAGCSIPLISAVGHETDWTLIDYVADQRAPTPTAAAEMVVPVRLDLMASVADSVQRLSSAMTRRIGQEQSQLEGLSRGLPNPQWAIESSGQRLDDWSERLDQSLKQGQNRRQSALDRLGALLRSPTERFAMAQQSLDGEARSLQRAWDSYYSKQEDVVSRAGALLQSFSYERVLDRGFALIRDVDGAPVLSAKKAKSGDALSIQLRDGAIGAVVSSGGKTAKPKTKKPKAKDDSQGDLF